LGERHIRHAFGLLRHRVQRYVHLREVKSVSTDPSTRKT
jgi:hypothetical protein